MTDADFSEWEGEVLEHQFQTWFERNQEALQRLASMMATTIARVWDWLKASLTQMWNAVKNTAAWIAELFDEIRSTEFRPPSHIQFVGWSRRHPPAGRDLRATTWVPPIPPTRGYRPRGR